MASQRKKPLSPPKDGGKSRSGGSSAAEEPPPIEAFGHKYHHSGRIFVPFDEKEQRRMELQHRLFRHCLNGALTATRIPLNVESILDLGSGTGLWPLEMAVRYPQANILGIDICRIQKTNAVPPNVSFALGNVENPWPIPAGSVDFLHARGLAGGVTDWPVIFRQAYEALRPGGLLEWTEIAIQIFDFDKDFGDSELCPSFLNLWRELSKRNNIDFTPSPNGPFWLVEAGFESIAQRTEILPIGNWAQDEKLKTRQAIMNEICNEHFENHCGLLFTKCGWTREEFDAVAPTFFSDLNAESKKPYTTVVFTTARKPRIEAAG
ncbi:putative umta methyltransferase family protein [Rosellinia necatrix]|uniref:Putative umta methyltransferase family protein n=1 Tax=Rosellinia necatrix TaxID=77044 RepID=A0A1W2TPA7_ROSNE|nr:putative umta methyltransferase family protein [Rosellinia necatrix]